METKVYILEKVRLQTKGLGRERSTRTPKFKFWNRMFPTVYLRSNPDITSNQIMIEQPMSKVKRKWQKIMFKIFNFSIGRILVITNDFDSGIKRYEYND